MSKFEVVSTWADADLAMPVRKTEHSAGYDMICAQDTIIPSVWHMMAEANEIAPISSNEYIDMAEMAVFTKKTGIKPTLVPTGMKCKMEPGKFLQLSIRSSSPLKYWLMLANGVGVIDADYYNNPDNEGHIYFQIINLSPYNVMIKKGEAIGQGIILPYDITEDDIVTGARTGGFGSTNG